MIVEKGITNGNYMKSMKRKSDIHPLIHDNKKKCVEVAKSHENPFERVYEKHEFSLNNNSIPYEKIEVIINDISKELEGIKVNEIGEVVKILNHFSFRQYFKHNLESYCSFIALVLEKCRGDSQLDFLKDEAVFHRNFVSENEFTKHFLCINLPSLVQLLIENDSSELFKETCKIFEGCVLFRKHAEFENFLNGILKLEKCKEKFDIPKLVLKILSSSYDSNTQEGNLTHKIVYQSIFNSFKSFGIIYKLFIVNLSLLGFDLSSNFEFHKVSKYKFTDIKLKKSQLILFEILNVIKNNKIELSCIIKITFSEFLENIVTSIINVTKTPSEITYKILVCCIEIHPLLAEKHLENLLVFSMMSDNSNCYKNYEEFMLKMFETYSKLHRIQTLIAKMLPIFKTRKELNVETFYTFNSNIVSNSKNRKVSVNSLSDVVLSYFTECIVQLASWQVMNLFKTFTFHLDSVLSEGWDNDFLEFLCKFFSCFLQSIRMAEHTVSGNVMEKFNTGMKDFKPSLGKFGCELLKREHDEKLVRAFLDLSLNWVELYMVFCYYNRNFVENPGIFYNYNDEDYIHAFLSENQWVLLTQRIENFGESNCECKNLMAQLLVQKLRMCHIFGGNSSENIQKLTTEYLCSNLETNFEYILNDKFIIANLLNSLNFDVLLRISDEILKKDTIPNVNSQSFVNALIHTIFAKISQVLNTKNSLFSCVFSRIKSGDVAGENESLLPILKELYEEKIWNCKKNVKNCDIESLTCYLAKFKKLPIIYLNETMQSIFVFCIFGLHQNFWKNCSEIKENLEEIIIGTLQNTKLDLLELFEPASLIKNITTNFDKKHELMVILSENVAKTEISLKNFTPGVDFLLENIEDGENLQFSILILNELLKVKKTKKCTKELKEICEGISEKIHGKLFEIIFNENATLPLIPAFLNCLKWSLSSEQHETLQKLMELLGNYMELIFSSENIPEGAVSLFIVILHNKTILKLNPDLVLKIWEFHKDKHVPSGNTEFSQLVSLIFENIPNENFERITGDLLLLTDEKTEDFEQFCTYLNIWSSIVTSNFNPVKSEIWQLILEKFLIKLDVLKEKFDEKFTNEIIQFELSIIQHHQLRLSPAIIGIFMLSPVAILRKKSHGEFYKNFNKSSEYLHGFLQHRNTLIMDRLPTFLKVFRILLKELCENCNKFDEIDRLANCAHQLEKILRQLVFFKKHVARIAPHLIADILKEYEEATLYPKVKVHLNNCIYSLISVCDNHAVSYLLRVLSSASTELFKMMYDNFNRFYRFKGKV